MCKKKEVRLEQIKNKFDAQLHKLRDNMEYIKSRLQFRDYEKLNDGLEHFTYMLNHIDKSSMLPSQKEAYDKLIKDYIVLIDACVAQSKMDRLNRLDL